MWIGLSIGVALATIIVALLVAMRRAEARARRALFRQLGLPEDVVDLLMARNGDVPAELALVRRHGLDNAGQIEPAALRARLRPDIRLVQPPQDATAETPPRPSADRRPN